MLGKTLGGCRLTKLLGKGAMGAVYKARQEKLDRDVAIKVIRPEMMTDQRMLKRFEVEARTVAKFNSAHVVLVHDVGFELGVHYLVMEFVEGKNLRDHVKLLAGGRLPAGEALPLLRQAIRGLEEAQRLAVVHRDIKPDNLMLTDRGTLKIADFGIAKPLTEDFSMTLTSELVGTPLYMSPEQCQGRAEIDFRSDMYSLGATFFYLLTGEPPIRASSVYELIATKTKMAHLCLWKALPGLDENNPLSRVIERMTELGREDRYPSYEALLNDLVLVEQGQTIVPKPKPIRTTPAGDEAQTRVTVRERGKGAVEPASHRGRLVVGALVLLAAIGGGYVWINQPGTPPDTGARVAAELGKLRQRLATDGPSQPLLEELGKVPAVRPEHVAERGRLIDDIEVGLRVKAALAAILKPAKLELPFDDLARFLEAVDRAAEPQPRPGKAVGGEVTTFCKRQREVARSEGELGALGLSTLATTFADWKERVRQNADEALVPEFEKQLDGVLAARVALYERLLSVRDLLNKKFPVDKLEEARQALRAGTMAGGGDVSESLTRIRAAFAVEGPIPSLLADANKLRPSDARQREEVNALVDAMGIAKTAADNATQIKADRFPEKPALPFDAVEEYLAAIARAFEPVRTPAGQYPEWAAAQMATLCARDTLQQTVVAACIAAWKEWQGAGAKGPDAVAGVALVRKAKAKAIELFPASRQELDAAIADAAMADADSKVMRAGKRQQWLAEAGSLASKLALVTTLGEWVAGGPAVETALAALRTSAAELGGDAEVAGTLKQLGDNAA
ncbi:MAG: serine/threonine-protein kinase, partial [Planctomycetota bacterium]